MLRPVNGSFFGNTYDAIVQPLRIMHLIISIQIGFFKPMYSTNIFDIKIWKKETKEVVEKYEYFGRGVRLWVYHIMLIKNKI